MTEAQKTYIENARKAGYSYGEVAKATGLSRDYVKLYCRRQKIAEVSSEVSDIKICRNCGVCITSVPGRKPRVFCSRECGLKWWQQHRGESRFRVNIGLTCANCNKPFIFHRNQSRKFCSMDCYKAFRRKGAGNDSQ